MTNAKKPGETIPEKSKDRIDLSESSIMFVFQNHLGLQFLKKTNIVLFRFISSQPSKGACWELLLANNSTFKLSHTDTAEKIMKKLPRANFFQISQSYIINLTFMGEITYKTHGCKLAKPFDHIKLTISREQLLRMKASFKK